MISTRRARSMSWFQPHSCRDRESSNTWNIITIVVIIIKVLTILTIGHESAMFCLESGLYSISSSGTHFLTYTYNISHFYFSAKIFYNCRKICHIKNNNWIKNILHFTNKYILHLKKKYLTYTIHFNRKNDKCLLLFR